MLQAGKINLLVNLVKWILGILVLLFLRNFCSVFRKGILIQ